MEDKCRLEYKHVYGKYPEWNFQENAEQWPTHIQELYKEQVQQRGKKKNEESKQEMENQIQEYILASEVI